MGLLDLVLTGAAVIMPVNTILLLGPDDFPKAERDAKLSAGAMVSFMIDASGKTVRCNTLSIAGDAGLAHKICPAMMKRWHKPAHRANGEKVTFVGQDFVRLLTPDTPQAKSVSHYRTTPDLELSVTALPEGRTQMQDYLLLDIDETGKATDCFIPKKIGPFLPFPPSDLPASLCSNLAGFAMQVEHDEKGKAVRYITSLRVRLTVSQQAGRMP